jgi:dipeptide/tripeptide permease
VLASAFGAAALGAVVAPTLRRLLRGSTRATCALLMLGGAAAMAVLAGPDVLVVAALGFAAYYVAHGAIWPMLSAVLHTRVDSGHRATAVSAMSLAQALGGIAGNLAVPPLAAALGTDAAFLAVAVVVLLGAAACLRLPRATVPVPADAQVAAA